MGPVAMGDHPSDSGTDMLLREKGNRSVSLLVNLWRFSSQVLPGGSYEQSVSVCVYTMLKYVYCVNACLYASVSICICVMSCMRVRLIYYQY